LNRKWIGSEKGRGGKGLCLAAPYPRKKTPKGGGDWNREKGQTVLGGEIEPKKLWLELTQEWRGPRKNMLEKGREG